jgi:hypothetical protein
MMTLETLLYALRQRLLNAWDKRDQEDLSVLFTTFGVLREESYASQNNALIGTLLALEDVTREALMGFNIKGAIPSIETIQAAFSTEPAVSS